MVVETWFSKKQSEYSENSRTDELRDSSVGDSALCEVQDLQRRQVFSDEGDSLIGHVRCPQIQIAQALKFADLSDAHVGDHCERE